MTEKNTNELSYVHLKTFLDYVIPYLFVIEMKKSFRLRNVMLALAWQRIRFAFCAKTSNFLVVRKEQIVSGNYSKLLFDRLNLL